MNWRRSDFLPPRLLRGPHVQSVLSSSPLRAIRARRRLHAIEASHEAMVLDVGNGIRLQGVHSMRPGTEPRGLVVLLHGWEGSVDSNYMRLTASSLLDAGFAVFRLNFRDHGDTHHLNEDLFHSNRLDEVVHAALDVSRRFAGDVPMRVAGYSLGGNFALRLALRAPDSGLALAHVAAVCPLLDPATTMDRIESGLPLYDWYFARKWRRSLQRKRSLFPQRHDFDDTVLALDIRALTDWLVQRHTAFGTLDAYFDGYAISGTRLAGLSVPTHILMAEDDPVIPFDTFRDWALPAQATLEIAPWGGHCAFIENAAGDGYAERWVAERLAGSAA